VLAGLVAWVTAWRVVIPRRLGVPYRWRAGRLYRDALLWAAVYAGLIALVAAVAWVMAAGAEIGFPGLCLLLPLVLIALAPAGAYLYARFTAGKLEVTRVRAAVAYLLVVLMANGLYLAFALLYGVALNALG
jgi:hypothetical protein